jgi:hypothetical protein
MTGKAVATGIQFESGSRLVGDVSYLRMGKPQHSAIGLDSIIDSMRDQHSHHQKSGVDAIQEEIRKLGDPAVIEILNNMLEFDESIFRRDQERRGIKLDDALRDINSKLSLAKADATLTLAEVVALRLYTTLAHHYISEPLRNIDRQIPCRLPVTTHLAYDATKKLRALNVQSSRGEVLWRGMNQLVVADDFLADGGTELGFMSATTRLDLAVRYSLSRIEEDKGHHDLCFSVDL